MAGGGKANPLAGQVADERSSPWSAQERSGSWLDAVNVVRFTLTGATPHTGRRPGSASKCPSSALQVSSTDTSGPEFFPTSPLTWLPVAGYSLVMLQSNSTQIWSSPSLDPVTKKRAVKRCARRTRLEQSRSVLDFQMFAYQLLHLSARHPSIASDGCSSAASIEALEPSDPVIIIIASLYARQMIIWAHRKLMTSRATTMHYLLIARNTKNLEPSEPEETPPTTVQSPRQV